MIGSWTLVTPPTEEPVTLAEIKAHLHISSTAEDSLLTLYAQMAREAVENECWRALMAQTWVLYLTSWPTDGIIDLPRPPLQSVTHIKYSSAGAVHTWPESNYLVYTGIEPGRSCWIGTTRTTSSLAPPKWLTHCRQARRAATTRC